MKREPTSVVLSLLLVLLTGCDPSGTHMYSGVYLQSDAIALRSAQEDWHTKGCPLRYDFRTVVDPTNDFFVFTNSVVFSNKVHHCCFGARRSEWPRGLLAITDDGVLVWIRDSDGQVTVAPDVKGVNK